jgi:cytochrome c oxidase subunit 2
MGCGRRWSPWEAHRVSRSAGRLRPQRQTRRSSALRRGLRLVVASLLLIFTATGCGVSRFGYPSGITEQSKTLLRNWQGSSIAALVVGGFVWGLILYSAFAFRRRSDELPRQVRYNLPIEILYTVVPVVIVAGLFYYTARDEITVNKLSAHPQTTIGVVGFRWNWTFNYLNVNGKSTNLSITGHPGRPAQLVLPVNRSIRFLETSQDVIHSFWVPEFLFKRDVIPGRVNQFEVTIVKTGTFVGRCAELCGVDHDRMNFSIKVVSGPEFDRYIAERQAQAQSSAAAAPALTPAVQGSVQ